MKIKGVLRQRINKLAHMKIKGVLRQRINKLAHARGRLYAKKERERLLNEFTTLVDEGFSFDELDRRLKLVEAE